MQAALDWEAPAPPPPPPKPRLQVVADADSALPTPTSAAQPLLPAVIDAAVWRGSELGQATTAANTSGWPELDAELPGGGWPQRAVCEVLSAQPAVIEWRLLTPALRPIVAAGGQVVVVGPPRHPHLPGLMLEGLDERNLIWIQAEKPAERLWVTEQLIRSNALGAVVAWLPHARQEQLRRLQVCAASCEGLVFLCRPEAARHESSAAPLRVLASVGLDWELHLSILKRRGPAHEGRLVLPSLPAGLASVLTPRMRKPSRIFFPSSSDHREAADVVGRPSAPVAARSLAVVR